MGKLTSLSRDHREGVVTSVGGIKLTFTISDPAGAAGLTEGQLVTYTDVQEGPRAPAAVDVRAHR
jgi:hypothetical protein